MTAFFKSFFKYSFGQWAIAFLMICLFSGVFLIVPFDINNAYDSIVSFILLNPYVSFFRNLHYWSAQLFLMASIAHVIDHLLKKSEKKLKIGVWFRLVISIVILYLAMLSGFLLKGDADSQQAWQIFSYLISAIPFIGAELSHFFLGSQSDLLLIPYIHHVATFTIIIILVLYEHAKQLWPKAVLFVVSIIFLFAISSFWQAPLHTGQSLLIKGPWYLLGLQELLHWMSQPIWSILFISLLLLAIFIIKYLSGKYRKSILWIIVISLFSYLVLTFIAYYFRGENWKWESQLFTKTEIERDIKFIAVWNDQEGRPETPEGILLKESCMSCHSQTFGFSDAHNPEAIGCSSCHLGNILSYNKEIAHKGMVNLPGNFSMASITCATSQCHPNEWQDIQKSLMTSNSGLVAVDKFVFHESNDLNAIFHIEDIGHTPAETHLRNLCASCHLGNDKLIAEPIHEKSRGGGCMACHLNYSPSALASLESYSKNELDMSQQAFYHPQLSLDISNDHCFGCHSRSGRISTNYEGWHETQISYKEYLPSDSLRLLKDKRVFEFVSEDIHHQKGLLCVDCHQYRGVMGDGQQHAHQEEAVKIQCVDCHRSSFNQLVSFNELKREEKNVFILKKFQHQDNLMLTTTTDQTPLVNTLLVDEKKAELISKSDLKQHPLNPPNEVCTASAHSALSCSMCHSAWVPQCIGCHNEFDEEDERGYDLLERKRVRGEWNEYIGKYFKEAPVIGVWEKDGKKQFAPAAPGMIMTIDTASFHQEDGPMVFHRLYAPVAPHTTLTQSRTCKSCHLSSLALGFGRGELSIQTIENTISWEFQNQFALSKEDGLPQDAWTGFFNEAQEVGKSTRSDFRSLNLEEQKKILLVGACLQCHQEDSEVLKRSLRQNFADLLKEKTSSCVFPNP